MSAADCNACATRAAKGLEGDCPACANDRARKHTFTTKVTPGPWTLRGVQIRADNGYGAHVATYQISRVDGMLLAAAPELLLMLLNAISTLDACEKSSRSHGTADDIRARLADLNLIALGIDEHGFPSVREDPSDTVLP